MGKCMERVADYIIERLVEKDIKHIFLITGRGILYLTDAVAKNQNIQAVSTYHEQGASYAAMAYAAASDGMAACLVSTGCAATNAVTAVLCAYQDNLPVVFISGQNMLNETTAYTGIQIRTYGSQEADIVSVVRPITKYAVMLTDAKKVAFEMDKAIDAANSGRKGPVWIDVPLDIQNVRIESDKLNRVEIKANIEKQNTNNLHTREIAEAINNAKRPVLFIGGGVRSANAMSEVKCVVETYQIPLVYSTAAADTYGLSHDLSIGAVGSLGGSRAGNFTVQNADLILVIGSKLCSQSVGDFNNFARDAKVIVVDIDPEEHKKLGIEIGRLVIADAKDFLQELLKEDIHRCDEEWGEKCKHWKVLFEIRKEPFITELIEKDEIDIYHFADILSQYLPSNATVITDAGFEELIIPSTIKYRENQRCLFPAAQGAMGYAIPAILGAYYAGRRNIIVVIGDGSFMMNMQELQLIGEYRIPVKIFVINNNMYAVIRKRQQDLFRKRTIGNDPSDGVPAPQFKKIADCFGIIYEEIGSEHELADGITNVLKMNEPVLCEVQCTVEQKYLHMSFGFNGKRKLIKRPLEDLSPFIDREIFRNEMVVKPLEE